MSNLFFRSYYIVMNATARVASDLSGTNWIRNPAATPAADTKTTTSIAVMLAESDEDELTVAEIIKTKPRTKIVREFFAATLATIKSDDAILFE